MELQERLELFQNMILCKHPFYFFEYDAEFNLVSSNYKRSSLFHKILVRTGNYDLIKEFGKKEIETLLLGSWLGLMWGVVYRREENALVNTYVMGPVFSVEISLHDMRNNIREFFNRVESADTDGWLNSPGGRDDIMHEFSVLPYVPTSEFCGELVMLNYCVNERQTNRGDITYHTDTRASANGDPDRHRTWMAEQALLHMVREGDLNYKSALDRAASTSNGARVKVKRPIQQAQVSSVIFTSLCVRAAIEGGLTPEVAYTVGDSYIQQILDCQKVAEIPAINNTMYDDFIHRVHKLRTRPGLSPEIQKCIDYIELHSNREVGLDELAEVSGYAKYYISRKFKDEMQNSVSDYSKMVRVERAKLMLESGEYSATQIAEGLGFCSASYFAKSFKRYTGVSPQEYKAQHTR